MKMFAGAILTNIDSYSVVHAFPYKNKSLYRRRQPGKYIHILRTDEAVAETFTESVQTRHYLVF
jgi:hypothetical protein